MTPLDSVKAFADFRDSSTAVLRYLQERLGFSLWMVTRTAGEDWIVLQSEDQGYGVADGDVFQWTDSFCSRMVRGEGPCIAPRSIEIPAYAGAPIGQQVPIGSYIGVPLTQPGGDLFGTLCAIDPGTQPEEIIDELPHIEMMARMLSTILEAEFDRDAARRRAERAEADAMTDALTGLYNRRGWNQLLAAEEARCQRYGHEVCVVSIDLDGLKQVNDTQGHSAGDELIRRLADCLATAVRESDVLARLGGDEFGILAVDCDEAMGADLVTRISDQIARAGVEASIGICPRQPATTIETAFDEARPTDVRIQTGTKRSCSGVSLNVLHSTPSR